MTWYGGRCGYADWMAEMAANRAEADEPRCPCDVPQGVCEGCVFDIDGNCTGPPMEEEAP